MAMLTDLADVARGAGLKVVEVDGWKTRGHHAFGRTTPEAPKGVLCHHTAGPRNTGASDYPSLRVVRDGMPGLSGPLAQLGLGFSGTVYVIAAGICYHSGAVDDDDFANVRCIGIEAENNGIGDPWPAVQYDAYVRLVAALLKHYGIRKPARGHKEAAVPRGRKVDPNFDMNQFRAAVAKGGGKVTATPAPKPSGPSGWGPDAQDLRDAMSVADVKRLQAILGVAQDGSPGEGTVRALQARFGQRPDGVLSAPRSSVIASMQAYLNQFVGRPGWCAGGYKLAGKPDGKLAVDGQFGNNTANALARYMTAKGKFTGAAGY